MPNTFALKFSQFPWKRLSYHKELVPGFPQVESRALMWGGWEMFHWATWAIEGVHGRGWNEMGFMFPSNPSQSGIL